MVCIPGYSRIRCFLTSVLLLSCLHQQILHSTVSATEPVRRAHGLEKRELWTTGNLQGTPDPPDPYTTERAFPLLRLNEPLSVEVVPGRNQFGVATRPGKIHVFDIRPDVDQAHQVIDLKRTVYGLTFHPKFEENGWMFVMSLFDLGNGELESRISRFVVQRGERLTADPQIETVIFQWPAGGHNGGCLRFGPDGYLYLSTGDGSGIADELKTGQDITDVRGAILRIDVNQGDGKRPYTIPADNPFVNLAGARGEIWALGLRQVWKFQFDPQGQLWAGEVGQDLWEMIHLIRRGGNYGWSVREGRHPFRPQRDRGPGEFQDPIVEHSHNDFRSITGGTTFDSPRLPELQGAYIYGDYDTGRLWSLRYQQGKVLEHRQLADTQIRLVEFARDPQGEIYLVDFVGGEFHRLKPAPPQETDKPFPRLLSQTGLFSSTADNRPATGLIPYSVNMPLWSDGAEKERFLALPKNSQIEFDAVVYPHGAEYPDPGWRFPDGSVLVKTFSLEMEAGNPASRKRLETRILQHRKMPGNDDEYGAQVWHGYTYVWNEQQTDAELLDADGLDRTLNIRDPAAPDGWRQQVWRFPSRAECTLCHTMASKYVLGMTTLQMNRDHSYGDVVANQLATLEHIGVFTKPLPRVPDELPRLADYEDQSADLHLKARGYLHANCAHCHRRWGGGNAEFELHASTPLSALGVVNTAPGQGTFQLNDPRIIIPGDPDRSLIVTRMELQGLGRMPHIASRVTDRRAVDLLKQWLRELKDPDKLQQPGALRPRLP